MTVIAFANNFISHVVDVVRRIHPVKFERT